MFKITLLILVNSNLSTAFIDRPRWMKIHITTNTFFILYIKTVAWRMAELGYARNNTMDNDKIKQKSHIYTNMSIYSWQCISDDEACTKT